MGRIQETGLFSVAVRGIYPKLKVHFRKVDIESASPGALQEANKELAGFGMTIDEFRANCVEGPINVEFESLGSPLEKPLEKVGALRPQAS